MIKVSIPFPARNIRIPRKSIPIYQNQEKIGSARVYTHKGEIMAKTALKDDFALLTAMGEFIMPDGDIIEEFFIDYLCV
jgi:hypothetical protein